MKIIIFFLYFFLLINISYNLIPLWNLTNYILSSDYPKNITLFEGISDNIHVVLKKMIYKVNDGNIKDQNYIRILDNEEELETDWENIESFYFINDGGHFICPEGQNFLHQYDNHKLISLKPDNFNNNTSDDWELLCYKQESKNMMFQAFLNLKNTIHFYSYIYKDKKIWENTYTENLLDFEWDYKPFLDDKYNMFGIIIKDSYILLQNILITINNENKISYDSNQINNKLIDYKSDFSYIHFNHNTKIFYWVVANDTTNFRSGYSTQPINISSNDTNITLVENNVSPFYFLNKVKIKKINMLKNPRFVYYEIEYNETKKEIYRGIIDIKLNKIIFNTNENFTVFKPLKNYSIIAFKGNMSYEICPFKNGSKCVDECPEEKYLIDSQNGNHCGNSQNCNNYLLKPYNICIESCDNKFYSKKEKECGLCKILFEDKPYKVINEEECKKEKPNRTYYINEEMKILDYCDNHCKNCTSKDKCIECEEGYELENEKCINKRCNPNCKSCKEYSPDDNYQNCTECNNNKFLQTDKGNCVEKCLDNYYLDNFYKSCLKCHEKCKKCSKGPITIENEKENENCDICNEGFIVIAEGFSRNCVSNCPNGTEIKENYYCKKIEEFDFMLLFFIIFTLILLILILYHFFKKRCSKNKNDSNAIIKDNNDDELKENINSTD